jgi:hypothetical protein
MERLVIDSVNYDYIPGEPESRRMWFITLRQPPYNIKPGMIVRVDSYRAENLLIKTGPAYYRVRDIYGTHVIVDPVKIMDKGDSISGNTNATLNNLTNGYARAGFYTYAQRPQTQYTPLSLFDIL